MRYALLVYLCHKRDSSHDSQIIWSIAGIQSSDSFHSNFECRRVYESRALRFLWVIPDGFNRDSATLLNFMGAASCVYTVRLCAREFIDSRVAASFARRTILSYRIYSLLAYRRRP